MVTFVYILKSNGKDLPNVSLRLFCRINIVTFIVMSQDKQTNQLVALSDCMLVKSNQLTEDHDWICPFPWGPPR